MPHFDGELDAVAKQSGVGEATGVVLQNIRERQRRWLKRKQECGADAPWRPRKRHRWHAWKWLAALDHQAGLWVVVV